MPGENSDVFHRHLGEIFILGSASKSTGLVREITIGTGGGDPAQSVRVLAVILSAAAAVTNVEKSEVPAAAMKVPKQTMNEINSPDASMAIAIVGNRKLSSIASKEMGLMFIISPSG